MRRLASFVIASRRGRLGVALGNERVHLVGKLGEHEQVVEAETVRGLPLVAVTVDPRKGDVVMRVIPPTSFSQTVALTAPILSSATGLLLVAID